MGAPEKSALMRHQGHEGICDYAPARQVAAKPESPEEILAAICEYLSPIFSELNGQGIRVSHPAWAIGILVRRLEEFGRERLALQAKISAQESEIHRLWERIDDLSLISSAIHSRATPINPSKKEAFS